MPDDYEVSELEAVPLHIRCPQCGQAVTLCYTRSNDYSVQHWTCPYVACGAINQVILGGTGLLAAARVRPSTC